MREKKEILKTKTRKNSPSVNVLFNVIIAIDSEESITHRYNSFDDFLFGYHVIDKLARLEARLEVYPYVVCVLA